MVEGGVGIEENLNVGGTLDITGVTTVNNPTVSSAVTNGALVVDGGIGAGDTSYLESLVLDSQTADQNVFVVEGNNNSHKAIFKLSHNAAPTDAGSGKAFAVSVDGEGTSRAMFYSDGSLGMGSGAAARDVYLYRHQTGTLAIADDPWSVTGGNLLVNQDLFVKGNFTTTGNTTGDILYFDGTTWKNLAKGSDDQILTLSGGLPSWAAPAGTPNLNDLTFTGNAYPNGNTKWDLGSSANTFRDIYTGNIVLSNDLTLNTGIIDSYPATGRNFMRLRSSESNSSDFLDWWGRRGAYSIGATSDSSPGSNAPDYPMISFYTDTSADSTYLALGSASSVAGSNHTSAAKPARDGVPANVAFQADESLHSEGAAIQTVRIAAGRQGTQTGNLLQITANDFTTEYLTVNAAGNLVLHRSEEAVSSSSGAFVVTGGAGIGGNLHLGGNLVVTGAISGSGIGTFDATTDLSLSSSTDSTSTSTGALVVSGGVGVGANLYIGGETVFGNHLYPKTGSANTFNLGSSSRAFNKIYAVHFVNVSDERMKKNVEDVDVGLEEVMALRPVSYEWHGRDSGERSIGLLAQEVESVLPGSVVTDDDHRQTKGVNYVELVPVLVKATQEQQAVIEEQRRIIDDQRYQMAKILERLEKLEKGE